jgi:hypothetical protein
VKEQRFWELIEKSRKQQTPGKDDGNFDRQARALKKELSKLKPSEVASFHSLYHRQMLRANSYDLWGAAFLLGGGCSEDGFHYFRNWLVSMGKTIFERALRNPETLAEAAFDPSVEDVFFEHFAYIAPDVYEELTGEDVPPPEQLAGEPSGRAWSDGEELRKRFPKIARASEARR